MIHISEIEIERLNIPPHKCIEWVKKTFLMKHEAQLPAKISVHPRGSDFFTTMPCLLPKKYSTFSVKIVSRIKGNHPALKSSITLYDVESGEIKALIDGNWITNMRTGAVAALAIKTFQKKDAKNYAFIGLGNTARATVKCLLESGANKKYNLFLYKYKNQAENFKEYFKDSQNIEFHIIDDISELISCADVVVSCITDADGLIVDNVSLFRPGVLLVPVHTRGFQNCDVLFEKVFADDTAHVSGFKNFSKFRDFHEFSDVLSLRHPGRENVNERIISYNIGLGLHDAYFAYKIFKELTPPYIKY